MRLLLFQARHFGWKTFEKTLADAVDQEVSERVENALVAFAHVEADDHVGDARARVVRHALKQIKWLANKRAIRTVVLHSFAHLGGVTATAPFADALLRDVGERLRATGYVVWQTPFGYTCEWDLAVYGEGIAKVWQQIAASGLPGEK